MKKVISFSLWGADPKYTIGATENARLAKIYYPDWVCRFYIGRSTFALSPDTVSILKSYSNVEIIRMPEEGDWTGMFWRFYPCSDPEVEFMLSRDCDCRLGNREQAAVKVWLRSNKSFHIMRDHPWHLFPIMGGMWGARTEKLRNIKTLIEEYNKDNRYNVDQDFLSDVIYPIIEDDCLIHDEFGDGKKFPIKRKGLEFVGQVFDPEEVRTEEHAIALKQELKKRKLSTKIKGIIKKLYATPKNDL